VERLLDAVAGLGAPGVKLVAATLAALFGL
jgi:hypothetical protein